MTVARSAETPPINQLFGIYLHRLFLAPKIGGNVCVFFGWLANNLAHNNVIICGFFAS